MASGYAPVIRRAVPDDAQAILTLVDALAEYEKLARPLPAAKERLVRDLFGPRPRLDCWLAFLDGYPVGYAFALETYSSFLALPTLYLEDLFVLPEYRARKAGYGLFSAVLAEARRRGCGRMEWTVLDWNQLAIDFYRRMGAEHMQEWQLYRITLA
jgi:GNAT superfamily N-acetyltransferase